MTYSSDRRKSQLATYHGDTYDYPVEVVQVSTTTAIVKIQPHEHPAGSLPAGSVVTVPYRKVIFLA